jgi:hypothetical protein
MTGCEQRPSIGGPDIIGWLPDVGRNGGPVNLPYYGLYGMYGPPPCCKRKVKMTVWPAQMYPVFY